MFLLHQYSIRRGGWRVYPPPPPLTRPLVPLNPQVCIDPENSWNKSKIHCWPPLIFPQIENCSSLFQTNTRLVFLTHLNCLPLHYFSADNPGPISVQVCAPYIPTHCCFWRSMIQVKRCSDSLGQEYFVYKLQPTDPFVGYCAGNGVRCDQGSTWNPINSTCTSKFLSYCSVICVLACSSWIHHACYVGRKYVLWCITLNPSIAVQGSGNAAPFALSTTGSTLWCKNGFWDGAHISW